MIALTTASERTYIRAMSRKAKARALREVAFQLVIESVHPGNLGVLPPSPEMLYWKASMLGILSSSECMEVWIHAG